jgi:hypothetical protein
MKSAPAAIASTLARRTLSSVPSSPVSRITLSLAGPQASLTSTTSSNTSWWRPARKAPRLITMSTSSAPASTASVTSPRRTAREAWPLGKAVATEATFTPEPPRARLAVATSDG